MHKDLLVIEEQFHLLPVEQNNALCAELEILGQAKRQSRAISVIDKAPAKIWDICKLLATSTPDELVDHLPQHVVPVKKDHLLALSLWLAKMRLKCLRGRRKCTFFQNPDTVY
jgi:dsDNA-binding SOS-regulon protein